MRAQTLNYRKPFPSHYFDFAPPYICRPKKNVEVLIETLHHNFCFDSMIMIFSATIFSTAPNVSNISLTQTQQYQRYNIQLKGL